MEREGTENISPHDAEKHYYEYLAKRVLETFLPNTYKNLELCDRPDIRSEDMGIEVTRINYAGDMEASKLFQLVKNKPFEKASKRALKRINQLNHKLLIYKGVICGITSNEAIWETTNELKAAFGVKLQKMQAYEVQTDLFLYSPSIDSYDFPMIKEFYEWSAKEQAGQEKLFGRLIVFDYETLYVCSYLTDSVDQVILDKNKIDSIVRESKKRYDLITEKRDVQ